MVMIAVLSLWNSSNLAPCSHTVGALYYAQEVRMKVTYKQYQDIKKFFETKSTEYREQCFNTIKKDFRKCIAPLLEVLSKLNLVEEDFNNTQFFTCSFITDEDVVKAKKAFEETESKLKSSEYAKYYDIDFSIDADNFLDCDICVKNWDVMLKTQKNFEEMNISFELQ